MAADIVGHSRGDGEALHDFLPLGAIPLFFAASTDYEQLMVTTAARLNQRYREFLASDEGRNFTGPVSVSADPCDFPAAACSALPAAFRFASSATRSGR